MTSHEESKAQSERERDMTKLDFGALLSPRVVMLGMKRLFTALTSHYASKSLKIVCLRVICILFFKHTSTVPSKNFLWPLHCCSEMSLLLVFHASWKKPVTKFTSSEINFHTPNRFCRLWYASKSLYLAGAYLILWLKIELRQTCMQSRVANWLHSSSRLQEPD